MSSAENSGDRESPPTKLNRSRRRQLEGQWRAADREPADDRQQDEPHHADRPQPERILARAPRGGRRASGHRWPRPCRPPTNPSHGRKLPRRLGRRHERAALVEEAEIAEAERVRDRGQLDEGEVDEEELDEQRRVADQLDVATGDVAEEPVRATGGRRRRRCRGSWPARCRRRSRTGCSATRPGTPGDRCSRALYGIGVSLISKPAWRPRKLKPKPRPRSDMAESMLPTMKAASSPTAPTTATWAAMRRTRTSRQSGVAPAREVGECAVIGRGERSAGGDGRPRPGPDRGYRYGGA